MNQAHLHLLITHLPIFGSILGGLVLAHGLWSKSASTKTAAYYLLILSTIGACIAYFTGEGAEEAVENMPGVVEATIKTHEDFALYALISLIGLGLISCIALVLTLKKSTLTRTAAVIVLCMSLISFGLVARTGYLGGLIRHTEVNAATNANAPESEKDGDAD